jgi:hypothetical protein
MKASAVSTITKSLPIALPVLVNYSLLATFGYINLFYEKSTNYFYSVMALVTAYLLIN